MGYPRAPILSCVLVSKSLASRRSCNCSSGGPLVRLTMRPAVKRGRMVNRTSGLPEEQLHERHDAGDFATKTQDKIGARG